MASDMSSLMDLVSQNQPRFKTNQALLVIGLQNDFLLPDGRLPVNIKKGFLERIQTLIPKFRQLNGNVIWVQTLYEADRIATDTNTGEGDALVVGGLIDGDDSEGGEDELAKEAKDSSSAPSRSAKHRQRALDLLKRVSARRKTIPQEVAKATAEEDDELFLLKSEKKSPACVPNTFGAEFADVIARQFELPADAVIRTTNYSAFQGTSLLITLRARLVTELYICGCITNVSVLATVIDAARHGIKINVIQDCLGYRKQSRHELALKRMDEFFDAYLVSSSDILSQEAPASPPPKTPSSPNGSRKSSKGNDKPIEAMIGKMSLSDEPRPASRTSNPRSPTRVLSGKPRTLSLVSVAESRKISNTTSEPATEPIVERASEPTDKQFTDLLVKGATVPGVDEQEGEKEKPNYVKAKIRMRSNQRKKKKKDKEKEKEKEKDKEEEESSKVESASAEAGPSAPSPRALQPPQAATEAHRTSKISKAESTANLREKEIRQQSLKSVASVPVLSTKNEEKERHRLSDLSDRVRMSLSRAAKSEPMSESKRGSLAGSIKTAAAPTPPAVEEKMPKSTPAKVQEPAPVAAEKVVQIAEVPSDTKQSPELDMNAPISAPPAKAPKLQSLATFPVLGPDDEIAEGDSRIVHDFFPNNFIHPTDTSKPLKDLVFTQLYNEVRWQKMLHQQGEVPRLVCCQGEFGEDGSMPVYRHPSDQTLPLLHFSPKVEIIRRQAEKLVGHSLNHVLIQLYRSGNDYISEHSDKTLDITKDSSIVNVSFGAQRTMRLRRKKGSDKSDGSNEDNTPRETQRVAMPHNSMFVLGLKSNEKWLHGIMADKRLSTERSAAETAYNGMRISLTFRQIGTFIDARESAIWGQGATAEAQRDAVDVINGDSDEAERMVRAFSRENHSPDFDWAEHYGAGFDILHLHSSPQPQQPLLFASNNIIETTQAQICLHEAKIPYTLIPPPDFHESYELDRQISFRDTDPHHTEVTSSSILVFYLDRYYPLDTTLHSQAVMAAGYPAILLATGIMKAWQNRSAPMYAIQLGNLIASLEEQVEMRGGDWITGNKFSIVDVYLWPVVHALVQEWDDWTAEKMPKLSEWYRSVWRKKASVRKMVAVAAEIKTEKPEVDEKKEENTSS